MATTTREPWAAGEGGTERLRREDPERTGPHRDWTAIPRSSAARTEVRTEVGSNVGEPADGRFGDAVTHGVRLGYRVVEEQIRQGRRAAEQMSRASYGPAAMSDDFREATERMWRYYSDLGRLWFDFVTSFTPGGNRSPDWFGGMPRGADSWPGSNDPWRRGFPADAEPDADRGASAVSVQVASRRPVRVTLDLHPGAQGLDLYTPELQAAGRATPSLTEVSFESGPPGCAPTVCIRVPDDIAPDTYRGVVIDRRTGRHVGTLSVCVSR